MVNKAVGKLFGHLKLPKGSDSKDVTMLSIQGRSSTIVKKKDFDDTNFSEVIKRLKQFEKELNRQRAAQQTEIMRYDHLIKRASYIAGSIYLLHQQHTV